MSVSASAPPSRCAGSAPVTVALSAPSPSAAESAVAAQRTVLASTVWHPGRAVIVAPGSVSVTVVPLTLARRALTSPGAAA